MADFTEEELAALRAAYASGATSVRYRDRTVTYASTEDLERRLRKLEAAVNPSKRRPRFIRTTHKKRCD